ncbi:MAG: heme lyase CcmF/NrfE family subunit [Rhodospirillales bacterium]|nr:heme lyase CcmF/NrfE family subunit [Rhodospirillales bacterium]
MIGTFPVPELGHFALALAVALAGAQAVLGLWGAQGRDVRLMAAAPALALGQFLALICAYGALVISAVTDDFSVLTIANNSNSHEPLIYKITGTWGDHEGSILLWCLILGLCGAAVAAFGRNLPSTLRARVIGVLGLVSSGFLLFALTASNPFLRDWPPPIDGRNLNPLLQDPGLAFHPPVLYTGYVGFAVPFAFAVAALLEGRVDASWGRWVRPWALASWCALTGGIALGSWWAYYSLGWGGFWFWDPVENASLLPWLTGTALIHSAIVVEKREALKIWTILLAIGTFSLSLSGTFLVRSGILNSVHAFANDPTRGVFILVLLGIVIGGALLLFLFRAPAMAPTGLFAPISREGALVLNNILLCAICAVVLTGTIYPLLASLLFHAQISVGAPYFDATVLPLSIPLFLAMAVGPVLPWKRAAIREVAPRLLGAAGLAALVALATVFSTRQWVVVAGFSGAAWLIGGAFTDIVARARLGRVPFAASLQRLRSQPSAIWGAAIAHAGMGITLAGLAGAALGSASVVALHPGQATLVGGYQFLLRDVHGAPGPNYTARIADIAVSRNGVAITTLHPSRRNFPVQQIDTTDAAISTNGLRDLYAVLGDEHGSTAILRLHVNPMAPWIWLGALVMAAGGGLSLADRRLRIGAPARRRRANAASARPA